MSKLAFVFNPGSYIHVLCRVGVKFLTEGGKGGTFGVNTEYLIRKQLLANPG